MNILWTLFTFLSILVHVEKVWGGELLAIRNDDNGPLVLIQEGDPPELKIAIPHKVLDRMSIAGYFYDDKGEYGPVQGFNTACPAYTDPQKYVEAQWRHTANMSQGSTLFFLQKYTDEGMTCKIRKRPEPSIMNTHTECGKSQGEIYQVGYSILDENERVQFMEKYEICHSKDRSKGTIYTTHRIDSPSLMLLKLYNAYEPVVLESFRSDLDEELNKVDELYKYDYIYQFVPRYDMPTVLWENTTLFPFNYTSVGPHLSIFKNMMKFDNFVRQFSKRTGKPLTIHSGTYQTTITENTTLSETGIISVTINSFWRVIMDDEKKATILITQYTRKQCESETYICNEDFVLLEHYEIGGCTYRCSVSDAVIELLHLDLRPETIEGNLELRYTFEPKSKSTPQGAGGQSDADAQSSSTSVDISDFGGGATFLSALVTAEYGDIANFGGANDGNGDGE